jgi:hypothetical protein
MGVFLDQDDPLLTPAGPNQGAGNRSSAGPKLDQGRLCIGTGLGGLDHLGGEKAGGRHQGTDTARRQEHLFQEILEHRPVRER